MPHPRNAGYKPGDHWAECLRCGFDYRSSFFRKEWTGLWVCKYCYEPRHPQDFVRAKRDRIAPIGPINSPDTNNTIQSDCTTRSSITGEAIAGCAMAGYSDPTIPSGTFNTNTL